MAMLTLEERCEGLSESSREGIIADLVKPMQWNPYQNKKNIPVYKYGLTDYVGKRLACVVRKPSEEKMGSLALGSKVYGELTTEPAQRVYYGLANVHPPSEVVAAMALWEAAYFFAGAGITKWDDIRQNPKTFSRDRLERMDLYSILLSSMQKGVRYLQNVHEKHCNTHANLPYAGKILSLHAHDLLPEKKADSFPVQRGTFEVLSGKQRNLFDNSPFYFQADI